MVRVLTAKGAVQALEWANLEPFIDEMLTSTTPAARFSALEAVWKQCGADSRAVQERFALDPHPHVRGTARWFLKTIPGFDAPEFFRTALGAVTDERDLIGAIEGLGEVGTSEDAALVMPFLRHERARVRTAAVHALGSIGSDHRAAIWPATRQRARSRLAGDEQLSRGSELLE